MSENWVMRESKKADKNKDVIILERPDVKSYLDELLLKRFWPVIRDSLENTGYAYSPEKDPETDFELSHPLERSLSFVLLEDRSVFFRGKMSSSKESWMLESEFFLGLSEETLPEVVFEILGNSRFAGMPPELRIDKKRDSFYEITFESGNGASWGLRGEEYVEERIKKVIDVNVEMYEFSKDGIISPQDLGEFLSIAYEAYEAF